ncbi:hypothetical protein QSH57_007129 [Fusarium oxysporum f. sp. vasinfectum]|nr:hypothetical protein QSH57_007129 [Fusarium oxysporum f. sp. vasinfectum]
MQVEEFTKRSLTKPTDRLPAFNAVSKSIAGAVGSDPLAGIWDGDKLFGSLCWNVPQPLSSPRVTFSGTPSWSWVAVTGEISYDLTSHGGRDPSKTSSGATLVSINIQAEEPSISIKGNLYRKPLFHSSMLEPSEDIAVEQFIIYRLCDTSSCIFLEHVLEHAENMYTFNALIFPSDPLYEGFGYPRWPTGRGAATLKLSLQRVENRPDTFRKIGLCVVPGESSDKWEGGGDDEPMMPLDWLATDEERYLDRDYTLI